MPSIDQIADFALFKHLCANDIEKILSCGKEASFLADDIILNESYLNYDLYVLLKGRAQVEIVAFDLYEGAQRNRTLATLKPGDIFGEIAFLEKKRPIARIIAKTGIHVYQLNGEALNKLFETDGHIGYQVLRNMATILAWRLTEINFMVRDSA